MTDEKDRGASLSRDAEVTTTLFGEFSAVHQSADDLVARYGNRSEQ